MQEIRREARRTAALFTWPEVIENLLGKLEYLAMTRGVVAPPRPDSPSALDTPNPDATALAGGPGNRPGREQQQRRARERHPPGRGILRPSAGVAQLVELLPSKQVVAGSKSRPPLRTPPAR